MLYISGEESFSQSQLRARRTGTLSDGLFMLTETEVVVDPPSTSRAARFDLIVVDSINRCIRRTSRSAGSISQVRDCASEFLRLAKGSGTPIF